MQKVILEMNHIDKSFFGKKANDDVYLRVREGEIHALLGENGAGKTTLMNILYGLYQADSGEIIWKGEPLAIKSPKDAIDRKIGMVHQHFTLVNKLSASENITLGLKTKGYPFTDRASLDSKISEISTRYGLPVDPGKRILEMSVGEQQRVEIMKLLYRDVDLLILDEPTAVLTPSETDDFFAVLERLREDGKAIIIITHRIPEVMRIANEVTVLRDGKVVCSKSIGDLDEEKLSQYMIGRDLSTLKREERTGGNVLLNIDGVSLEEKGKKVLDNLCIKINEGEILGIAGVDGNGQKQLAEVILGIRKLGGGSIYLDGNRIDQLSIEERKNIGIGYISDDRHRDGLVMDMNLEENMLLRSERSGFLHHGFIDKSALKSATEHAISEFSIKTHSSGIPVRLLSGGNQQKLIIAREIHDSVRLVIAFQPTRGLDIGASEFVRSLLLSERDKGCAVLLISADLEEIFSISDEVAVIHSGRIMGIVRNNSNVDMTRIGLMMAGKEVM